jgi:hypothetical protein
MSDFGLFDLILLSILALLLVGPEELPVVRRLGRSWGRVLQMLLPPIRTELVSPRPPPLTDDLEAIWARIRRMAADLYARAERMVVKLFRRWR